MRNKKEMGRGTIYAMAGIYICITAYQMYGNLGASMGGEQLLVTLFIILFAILGAGLVVLGGYMIYKGSKTHRDGQDSKENDKGNNKSM